MKVEKPGGRLRGFQSRQVREKVFVQVFKMNDWGLKDV